LAIALALSIFLLPRWLLQTFHHKRLFPVLGASDPQRYWARQSGCFHTAHPYPEALFCDVLVIGAGPSGLAAGLAAADAGVDVVIVDENARAGGSGSYQLGGDSCAERWGTATCGRKASAYPPLHRNTGGGVLRGSLCRWWIAIASPKCERNDDRRKWV